MGREPNDFRIGDLEKFKKIRLARNHCCYHKTKKRRICCAGLSLLRVVFIWNNLNKRYLTTKDCIDK